MSIQNTKNLDRKWPPVPSDFLRKFILFANGVYGLGMPIANTSKSNNNASHDFSKGFHNWLVCLFRDVWRRPKVQVVRGQGSSIPAEKILVKNGTSGLRRLLLVQTNLVSSASSSNQPSFPRQLARPIHQLEDAYLMHCKGAQNMANLPAFNWSQNIPSKPSLSYLAHFFV